MVVSVTSAVSELRKNKHKNVVSQMFFMSLRLELFNRLSCLKNMTAFS